MSEALALDTNSFFYEGKKYTLFASLFYQNNDKGGGLSLNTKNIIDLEISIGLNKLYSDGFIVYKDETGDIGKMYGLFNIFCNINFMQFNQEGDGDFNSEKVDKNQALNHTFFVDNIEIVQNEETSITYTIHLTGIEYQTLLNHVNYTDYDKNQKKNLIELLKTMLVDFGKGEVDEGFDKVQSGISFHYMSNGNDTVQSSIDYILQKQFFMSDSTDKGMKFLTYDLMDGKFKIFQFGPTGNPTQIFPVFLTVDNNSALEEFTQQDKAVLASVSDVRKTDLMYKISKITTRTYSLESNTFGMKDYTSQNLINFFTNGEDEFNRLKNVDQTPLLNIVRDVSEWDNDTNVYRDFVDIFTKWDSIIINIGGVINRRIMSQVCISINQRVDKTGSDNMNSVLENMDRYSQLNGPWYITKVRYIIKPQQGKFKQNLRLSRVSSFNCSTAKDR